MGKRLYTEQDIRAIAARGDSSFVIGMDDIITPLALDAAQQARIRIVRSPDPAAHHDHSHESHDARSSRSPSAGAHTTHSGTNPGAARAVRIDGRAVEMQPFPFELGHAAPAVSAADVVGSEHGSPMGAGFLSFHNGSFPWKLTYDEVQYVIEGELHIELPERTLVGKPGDVLFVPKGSEIRFATPSWAKILYVTYPADWAG